VQLHPVADQAGSLVLEFTSRDGRQYSGPVSITVGEISDSNELPGATHTITGSSLRFVHPPYVVPVVPVGALDIQVTYPRCEKGGRAWVEVEQGNVQRASFVVK
jgi:hypothetical protein